jgi:hypothetical protein
MSLGFLTTSLRPENKVVRWFWAFFKREMMGFLTTLRPYYFLLYTRTRTYTRTCTRACTRARAGRPPPEKTLRS